MRLVQLLSITAISLVAACGGGDDGASSSAAPSTTVRPSATTTTRPTSSTLPMPSGSDGSPETASCPPVAALPSGATNVSTAPVDFDGDGVADTLFVYDVGGTWHVRAEVASIGVDDQIVTDLGPAMTAIGGATIDGDAAEEAWVKVGSGAPTDIITFFVFRQCGLQRVQLNNAPAQFPIGASVTHADGLHCFGFDVGIEVFETNSSDGLTYAGTSSIYTIDLAGPAPSLVLGSTAAQSEVSPPGGPAFDALSSFSCDDLSVIP